MKVKVNDIMLHFYVVLFARQPLQFFVSREAETPDKYTNISHFYALHTMLELSGPSAMKDYICCMYFFIPLVDFC